MTSQAITLWLCAIISLSACAQGSSTERASERSAAVKTPTAEAPAVEPQASRAQSQRKAPRWLFVGDSLTAGFGLSPEESYVAVLERSLKAKGHVLSLRNAGVSGDTSAGVKRRLPWLLKRPPEVMFLCIGANDGMRGQPTEALAQNLKDIVSSAREAGVKRVILMGMRLPPNYGEAYVKRFEAVYPAVAHELGVPLMPFLLEGVGGEPSLNLSDGIHPNKAGHERVASGVERFLTEQRLLAELLGGTLESSAYEPR